MRPRVLIALTVGVLAAVAEWHIRLGLNAIRLSDFAQLWHAASAFRQGIDPYTIVGPGRSFDWPFPLLYPLPAVIVAVPFSYLPLAWAEALFVGLGACALAWALLEQNRWALWAFYSFAMYRVCSTAQWSPLMTAAGLLPSLGWLLACKPTLGAALWVAYPSRRSLVLAATFMTVTVLLWPWWVRAWVATLPSATHMLIPALEWRSGGPLLLLSALAWRKPEGRLLLALSCLPQTPVAYEVIPLFLIAGNFWEGAILSVMTVFWQFIAGLSGPAPYDVAMAGSGRLEVALCYLPCLGMVLRRLANSCAQLVRVEVIVPPPSPDSSPAPPDR